MPEAVIELSGVGFAYGAGPPVLEDVDLTVRAGDYVAVLGPNGGGKTTLLKLILGSLRPERGRVRVLGQSPGQGGALVGYMPQMAPRQRAFPLTVMDAVLMGRLGRAPRLGPFGRADRRAARQALGRVGMPEQAGRMMAALSGGQRQRVLIARALASEPSILLLDEPTASVDAEGRAVLFDLLAELNQDMTIVCVSHDFGVVARGVRSVACVNRRLHFHDDPSIDRDMLEMMYGRDMHLQCPVELVAHGEVPHRVLARHPEDPGDKEGGQ